MPLLIAALSCAGHRCTRRDRVRRRRQCFGASRRCQSLKVSFVRRWRRLLVLFSLGADFTVIQVQADLRRHFLVFHDGIEMASPGRDRAIGGRFEVIDGPLKVDQALLFDGCIECDGFLLVLRKGVCVLVHGMALHGILISPRR